MITVLETLSVAPAVAPAVTNEFTTTGPFMLYGDYFETGEAAVLYRLGPSGDYIPATNKDGAVAVTKYPNSVLVEAFGTFRVGKGITNANVAVGYEEQ